MQGKILAVALIIVLVGALNWGLVLAGTNVTRVFRYVSSDPVTLQRLDTALYGLVVLSALYVLVNKASEIRVLLKH